MNAIAHAMKQAGVPMPPLTKRVWLWLHDHPGKTSKDIGIALGAKHSDVATVMDSLYKRTMVARAKDKVGRTAAGSPKEVFVWSTVGKSYELLPMPKKVARAPVVGVLPAKPPVVPAETTTRIDLESMTLRELRALYIQLKEIFQ